MVYEFMTWFSSLFEKGQIPWENGSKTVYDIYSCSTLISAILALAKHGPFAWSYLFSINRVQWSVIALSSSRDQTLLIIWLPQALLIVSG